MTDDHTAVRLATPADAPELAQLLHDFNTEFDTPSPGPAVLAPRLAELLAANSTFAVLAGTPAVGLALVTVRPNVWYDGPVALLDELYVAPDRRNGGLGTALLAEVVAQSHARGVELVEINVDEGDVDAQRFYVRHGFSATEPDTGERAFYFFRELGDETT
jgi:GNAT superfamily N-acetyltransferase